MFPSKKYSVLLLTLFLISFEVINSCDIKKFLMGNKASVASRGGSTAVQSIFDFKVDAINGVVDLATYK